MIIIIFSMFGQLVEHALMINIGWYCVGKPPFHFVARHNPTQYYIYLVTVANYYFKILNIYACYTLLYRLRLSLRT